MPVDVVAAVVLAVVEDVVSLTVVPSVEVVEAGILEGAVVEGVVEVLGLVVDSEIVLVSDLGGDVVVLVAKVVAEVELLLDSVGCLFANSIKLRATSASS